MEQRKIHAPLLPGLQRRDGRRPADRKSSGAVIKNRRVCFQSFGGPEVLQVIEQDLPEPQRGEVRVQILASGVSFADLLMREGVHPEVWYRRRPITLGWDLIGTVDACGDAVKGWEPGTRVVALPVVGANADFICLPASELVCVPDGLDPFEAVCLVFNYATAYQMLHRSAGISNGEQALIHSAAGGIGSALLQLGRVAGLRMFGTASTSKHALVEAQGAIAIDYRTQDFVQEIHQLAPDGLHLAFDGIGGKHLSRSFETLRPGGRLIAYGLTSSLQSRRRLSLALNDALAWMRVLALNLNRSRKRVKVYSIQSLKRVQPDWFRQDLAVLFSLLREQRIHPLIAAVYPLERAAEAHRLLQAGATTGKILLAGSASSNQISL